VRLTPPLRSKGCVCAVWLCPSRRPCLTAILCRGCCTVLARYVAVEKGHLLVAQMLLERSTVASVFRKTKYGTTPMYIAQRTGSHAMQKLLLEFCLPGHRKARQERRAAAAAAKAAKQASMEGGAVGSNGEQGGGGGDEETKGGKGDDEASASATSPARPGNKRRQREEEAMLAMR